MGLVLSRGAFPESVRPLPWGEGTAIPIHFIGTRAG
jgi:hypothetical protein